MAARVLWTPDGDTLVAVTQEQGVVLWDPATGTEQRRLDVTGGRPECVALDAAGKLLAVGTHDGAVEIWQLAGGNPPVRIPTGLHVNALAFTPDGKTLVGALRSELRTWDAATGEGTGTFGEAAQGANDVAVSPDGGRVATAMADGSARIWDLATRKEIAKMAGPGQSLHAIAWGSSGTLAAGTGVALGAWEAASGKALGILGGPLGTGYSVAFSRDGKHLATGGNGAVELWVMPGGSAARTLAGLTGAVRGVAFSPDGKQVAAVSDRVAVWDVRSGELRRAFGGKTPAR